MPKRKPKPKYPYPSQNERPVFSTRLPEDTAAELRGLARRLGVSVSTLLTEAADALLKRDQERERTHPGEPAACRRIYSSVKAA